MSLQQSPTIDIERPDAHNGSQTRLRGRWLFIARAGWVVLTLLVLTLNAISIPRAVTLLQAVCQPGALCISGLTPADLRQLQQLGLSPGFLAAYQIGWDVGTTLIYTALAALIFWRRSVDRMALFCAYMLVLFGGATYTGLLDAGLRTGAPAWYWLVGGLELVAQVSVPTFFLLFPSGRFVPRWTRWAQIDRRGRARRKSGRSPEPLVLALRPANTRREPPSADRRPADRYRWRPRTTPACMRRRAPSDQQTAARK